MTISEIIYVVASIVTAILGFLLGQYAERRKQSLTVRSEMLKPIEEWLTGAEKLIGIFGDTLTSTLVGSQLPITYNLEERRKVAQFMTEKSNLMFGVLASESLKTWKTRKFFKELNETIKLIDLKIKTQLLPMDNEILDRAKVNKLTPEFLMQFGQVKLGLDGLVQKSYSLISKIKTTLI
jgi:hypothetical protein